MLRLPVDKIEPGMVLARPVPQPNDPCQFLVQRDQVLNIKTRRRLKELGVNEVWIRYRALDFMEDLIDEEVTNRQREVYTHVRKNFEQVISDTTVEMDLDAFSDSVGNLFDSLKRNSTGTVLLEKLDAFDNYLMSHSTNVCFLSLLLGMKLQDYIVAQRPRKSPLQAIELRPLGLGALLHDIGKMMIPKEILNKPGKLTKEEMDAIKMHPVHGYEMLKNSVPAATADVVLNHHQRFDGTGYPARVDPKSGEKMSPLKGKQISIFSRIATISDIYDAATTKRCYSEAKLPVQVLHELRTFCRGFFDPVVEKAFYEIVPPFPIGQMVTLSDGSVAVVVDFNQQRPIRPKVQCIQNPDGSEIANPALSEIDLRVNPELMIVEVNGIDIREFQECQLEDELANNEILV